MICNNATLINSIHMNRHIIATIIKKLIYPNGESYSFASRKLKFRVGTRPYKRKYRNSRNDVVANDILQIDFFEKNFSKDDIFWDIGSHYGHYSIFAASVVRGANQVFSFEPDIKARNIQKENIELNGFTEKVKVYEFAISNINGKLRFQSKNGDSTSAIVKNSSVKESNICLIESRTVESLLEQLPRPTFIKIDTEGAEIDILKSSGLLLEDKKVKFICELHPFAWQSFNVNYDQLKELLNSYGRHIDVIHRKKSKDDLPFYGTIIF